MVQHTLSRLFACAAPIVCCMTLHAATESSAESRVNLHAVPADAIVGLVGFEKVTADRVPNYLRMMGIVENGPERMANMARAVLYGGRLDPELKMAMGSVISREVGDTYIQTHMDRLLNATDAGQAFLATLSGSSPASLTDAQTIALSLARTMVHDTNGFNDKDFRRLRAHFSEPDIVELTLVSCYFDYISRVTASVALPVEAWAMKPAESLPSIASERVLEPAARIGMLGAEEVMIIADRLNAGAGSSALGLRIANSVRAMARVPDIQQAWRSLSFTGGDEANLEPVIQHHVSNAVSYANGCLYCKTHQVQKLARSGLTAERIARSINDPRSLEPHEQLAVRFARLVTLEPTNVTDEDYRRLRETFGERAAFEVLFVAARFNFMNRFTGSLALPPEPAPMETYEQVERARRG